VTPHTSVCFGQRDNVLPPCLLLTKEPPKVVSWPQHGGSMHLQPIPAMHVHTSTRNLQKLSDLPCSSTGHCHSVPPRWPDHPVFRTAPQIWCRQSHRHQALLHSTGRADRISCAWVSRALALPSLLCVHHTRLVYCRHVSLMPSSPDCHVSPSFSPRLLENIYIWIQDFQPSSTG
jgi:hypothetical protein